MKKLIRTIFFGTPKFAVPSLERLLNNQSIEIIAVVTQPDKKVGRKQELQGSPIKKLAELNNLPVLQPDKLDNTSRKELTKLKPGLFIVVAYGFILPREFLDLPKLGCLNLHASLLPKYRGPSPIQAAIQNGDKTTGNTIMLVDEKMDHGPILAQQKIEIRTKDTGQTLHDKLADSGAELLDKTINSWIKKEITLKAQDDNQASYCQLIKREDGKINWQRPAIEIERQIRAFHPWPGTFTLYNNKRIKILSAKVLHPDLPEDITTAGQTFLTPDKKLGVTCGKGTLVVEELQLEGGKATDSKNFILGHANILNQKLTN